MAVKSVAQMVRKVEEHVAGTYGGNVLDEAIEVAKRVKDGEGSTGSKLADLVTVRSGIFLPNMARRYREAEQRIAEGVGQVALVVVNREVQDRVPGTDNRWSSTRGRGGALACRITDPEVVIDAEKGTWSIAAEEYFKPYMGERNLEGQGPMPVNDLLAHPAVQTLSSTLGQEFCSETTTRPSGDHVPHPIVYRVLQETQLFIGEEIDSADIGLLGVIELVPPVETPVAV